MTEDYYRKLGVRVGATADQIHQAYRALAMRYHPDRNRLPEAPGLMAAINEAYEILGKPAKRAAYDRTHSQRDESVDEAVLGGARNILLNQAWTVVTDHPGEIVLKNGSRWTNVRRWSPASGCSPEECHETRVLHHNPDLLCERCAAYRACLHLDRG